MRIEAVDSARKRLTLGLVARKASGGEDGEAAARDELGGLQPGDVVRGSVEKVQRKQVSSLSFRAFAMTVTSACSLPSDDTRPNALAASCEAHARRAARRRIQRQEPLALPSSSSVCLTTSVGAWRRRTWGITPRPWRPSPTASSPARTSATSWSWRDLRQARNSLCTIF